MFTADAMYSQDYECVSCSHNTIDFSKYASGTGIGNTASGMTSYAGGYRSVASGDYSLAIGRNAFARDLSAIAIGENTEASWMYSVAIGRLNKSTGVGAVSMGYMNHADANFSFLFGRNLKTQATNSMAIGVGSSETLANGIPNSLMVGFNSNVPTFFVETSPGASKTGRIGIGNITAPVAKLHILGDNDASQPDNASLYIQSAGDYYSTLWLGDQNHYIKTKPNADLLFNAANENFIFESGNVGIGTAIPQHPLQVNGNIMIEGQVSSLLFAGEQKTDWGEWGIEYENGGLNFWKPATSNNFGNYFLFLADDGQVGIGTNTPGQKLEVAGNILTTGNINASGDIDFGGNLLQNGVPFQATKWQENGANLYYNQGNVGIGTSTPPGLLSLYNTTGQHASASFQSGSSTRYWAGINAANNAFVLGGTGGAMPETGAINVLNGNVGIGILPTGNKALEVNGDINFTGQLYENGQLLDINIWEQNGNIIYYNAGKVGIGTNTPTANLHIKDTEDIGENEYRRHLKIESLTGLGGGTTEVGRIYGSGPILLQKAGPGIFDDGGPRLLIQQKSNTNSIGLSISTYTTTQGNVDYADIVAESSELYVRAQEDLILRSRTGDLYLQTADGAKSVQINEFGQVGIGTFSHIDQGETKLTVAGRIHAREVKVTAYAGGADFVFDDDYNLLDIYELDSLIKANRHLPDIPSANEMQQNGLDLGEMQIKILQKVEELTLYVIELKKENEEMIKSNAEMKTEIEQLKRR